MSAEGILENPALFSNQVPDLDHIALEYLDFATKYKPKLHMLKSHLYKWITAMDNHNDLEKNITLVSKMKKANYEEVF